MTSKQIRKTNKDWGIFWEYLGLQLY
jgi:hypothetical protein